MSREDCNDQHVAIADHERPTLKIGDKVVTETQVVRLLRQEHEANGASVSIRALAFQLGLIKGQLGRPCRADSAILDHMRHWWTMTLGRTMYNHGFHKPTYFSWDANVDVDIEQGTTSDASSLNTLRDLIDPDDNFSSNDVDGEEDEGDEHPSVEGRLHEDDDAELDELRWSSRGDFASCLDSSLDEECEDDSGGWHEGEVPNDGGDDSQHGSDVDMEDTECTEDVDGPSITVCVFPCLPCSSIVDGSFNCRA